MLGRSKIGRIAAFAFDSFAKGNTNEVAFEIITPLMIDTDVGSAVAAQFSADQGAAMSATIDKSMEATLLVARHDNRCIPDKSSFEISRFREFRLQRHIVPDPA